MNVIHFGAKLPEQVVQHQRAGKEGSGLGFWLQVVGLLSSHLKVSSSEFPELLGKALHDPPPGVRAVATHGSRRGFTKSQVASAHPGQGSAGIRSFLRTDVEGEKMLHKYALSD